MKAETPGRVLIVMDRPLIAETVALTLNHGVFNARVTSGIEEAAKTVAEWHPHIAVVDMDLGDGHLLEQIGLGRANGLTPIPVLAMTRRGDLSTKLGAFEQGVDDIMTVPFSPEELLARVLAIFRRVYGGPLRLQSTLKVGELEIDIVNRQVKAGSSQLHMTSLEQSLLYFLAANADRVVTRDEILDALWGVDFVAESNVVDRHVRSLRVKLQNDWKRPRYIQTVPGQGYRFLPVAEAANPVESM